MARKILVVTTGGGSFDFTEAPASNEHELQEVMLNNPQLIPAKDLGFSDDLLVVGRETTLASGFIDLLCVSSTGEVVIIEFKTGPQNPDFRHALAQVIDYGADLWRLSDWREFDQGVVHRYLNGPRVDPAYKACKGLREAAEKAWDLDEQGWDMLTGRLDQVLGSGDFHFVVAAQRFTDAMKATVEYLNEVSASGRFFLIELIRLDGTDQTAYAAQVVQMPPKRSQHRRGPAGQASEDEFLGRIEDAAYREAMSELFATTTALGLTLAWGSKGASIRLNSPDRDEPISVGWVFLEGDQWTWARHVTMGVDPSTAKNHPTIADPIHRYCAAVKAVPGATIAGGKSNAAIFKPAVFTEVRAQLFELLAALNKDVEALPGP